MVFLWINLTSYFHGLHRHILDHDWELQEIKEDSYKKHKTGAGKAMHSDEDASATWILRAFILYSTQKWFSKFLYRFSVGSTLRGA